MSGGVVKFGGQIESLATEYGRKVQAIRPYGLITQEEIDALGELAKNEISAGCKSDP